MNILNWFGSLLGYLLWFFYNIVQNYGIAIILFTIATKILLFPFSVKQQKSMAANSKLALKQKELQKRYETDKAKLQQETAKLYEQENINPMSGCLITLLPLPIMMGIYYSVIFPLSNMLHLNEGAVNQATALMTKIPGIGSTFTTNNISSQIQILKHFDSMRDHLTMFAPDQLANIESLSNGFHFLGLNLLDSASTTGILSWPMIIPVLCFVTSIFSQMVMMKMQPGMDQQQGCMKWMLYLMPLFSAWIAFGMPNAVGLYWVAQTVVSFFQTIIINKFYSPALLGAKAEAQRIVLREAEEEKMKPLAVPLKAIAAAAGDSVKKPEGKKDGAKQGSSKNKGSKGSSNDYMGSKK